MLIKNILSNKKNFLKIILVIENLLIISLLFYFIVKNLKDFKENFSIYFYTFDIFILENYLYLIFSLISLIFVIISHLFLWRKIFQLNGIYLTPLQSLSFFSFIHFKRLFSPFGPISPILNINNDLKKSALIYSLYVYFIILGSIIFFSLFFIMIYPILTIFLPLIIYFNYLLIKKIRSLQIDISPFNYFYLIIFSLLNEIFSFVTYYFSLKLFNLQINILESLFVYFVWSLVSSISPFLYGSGTSEFISIIVAYILGYDSSLFGLAIIFYRLIITYLPLLGLVFFKKFYPQFTLDK
ncbi:MAG: flippase-like domain-containing protein [Patescibacteria group bacterium]|nr:flippase-like domain-containing protein [Patescibacteria group bacterium]